MDIFKVSHVTATFQNHGSNLYDTNFGKSNTKYYVKKNHGKKYIADFLPEIWCPPQLSFDGNEKNQIKTINAYLSSIAPAQVTPEKKRNRLDHVMFLLVEN